MFRKIGGTIGGEIGGAIGGAIDGPSGALKMDTSAIDDVMGDLMAQQNMLNELIQGPLQAIIGDVTGGVWTGDGANAFVQELSEAYVPGMQNIFSTIGGVQSSVSSAMNMINEADSFLGGGPISDFTNTVKSIGSMLGY